MENIPLGDLPDRPLASRQNSASSFEPPPQDSQRYASTPGRLETGLQQPPDDNLSPSFASSPDIKSSFDSLENQIAMGADPNVNLQRQDYSDEIFVTKETLKKLVEDNPMPQPRLSERHNKFRYYYFGVYEKLFAAVLGANLVAIVVCAVLKSRNAQAFTYKDAVTAVAVNILLALMVRQEIIINMLFIVILSVPQSWPLSIRRHAAKVYCYGGMHPSSGISAVLWYIFFVVLLLRGEFSPVNDTYRSAVEGFGYVILICFSAICILSIPPLRSKWHNAWELSHRWIGWIAVAVIWAQLCCIVASDSWLSDTNVGLNLVKTPAFWMIIAITIMLILPWLRLRKLYFKPVKLSSHLTQLHFKYNKVLPACVGIGLSRDPLFENHKFATIPNFNKEPGFSVIIANAGDWTKKIIDDPPAYLWTRGIPTLGVARGAKLFTRIVLVATGSGIGPLMSFFNVHPEWDMRIVWSVRDPIGSYGQNVLASVLRADPKAIIINTRKAGMKDPDMPSLQSVTYGAYRDTGAEAVVVISNPKVTKDIIYDLEKREVPAYGAIFDS